jgi:beta-glucanase (GH16 family)
MRLLGAGLATLTACGGGGGGGAMAQPSPSAATVAYSVPAGAYAAAQTVTITDATSGALIYYTTNGTTPTAASTRYTAPIAVTVSETLTAIAIAPGYGDSAPASVSYTIAPPPPPPVAATPVLSLASGTYTGTQTVTISDATSNATIYYTTNGATPTAASTVYRAPITVSVSETLTAVALAPGFATSAEASASYTLNPVVLTPTPTISGSANDNGAQNGAAIVTLSDAAAGAKIYYTLDGSAPTTAAQIYEAPFLVDSNLTVKAIAVAAGLPQSAVATLAFAPNIASGTLVWSDEFNEATTANTAPNPLFWTYDVGAGGFGNAELEHYCAYGSAVSPCVASAPNAYVGTDGYLHIVAQQPSPGVYTSARLKTQGLFSFQYGRFEVRVQVPEAQGFWPAAWLMGNDITTLPWPGCGEMDVQERVDAADTPDKTVGSIHGTGFTGGNIGTTFYFPTGQTAATFHTYGMIWSPGSVAYYVDDPSTPYATFTPASVANYPGSVWPFDTGPSFVLLNLAIGGNYPGSPNGSTPFPAQTLVDYVRIYKN